MTARAEARLRPGRASRQTASPTCSSKSLASGVYERIKAEIFDFALLPGDRFTWMKRSTRRS
ncbi:MAG: hypothetical protein ACXWCX_11945 [Burkholderiales bacterium]